MLFLKKALSFTIKISKVAIKHASLTSTADNDEIMVKGKSADVKYPDSRNPEYNSCN